MDRLLPRTPGAAVERAELRRWPEERSGTVSFDAVRIAWQGEGAAVVPETSRKLTFAGEETVRIPAGGSATSDPVAFDVRPFEHLAVSFHVVGGPVALDIHPEPDQVSYLSAPGSGAVSDDATGAAFTDTTTSEFVVDRLDVLADQVGGVVVTFGDSITDGSASTSDKDRSAGGVASPAPCGRDRRVPLPRLRAAQRPREIVVRVAGRRRATIRGAALRRAIGRGYLTVRLPRGTKPAAVELRIKTRSGRVVRRTRTYSACSMRGAPK